ncbi:FtsX-like permease family protein [Streptomyces albus]
MTRSALLITALQLVLLTGLTLLLVAQLLRTERAAETALLRARGASRARICALAAAEAFLLALPAALAAPLLTGPALRLLSAHGAPDGAGLLPPAGPGAGTWWTAAAVAAGCALLLTGPTLLARGTAGTHDPDRRAIGRPRPTRRRATVTVLRGGVDLALVVLAVVAYAQLAGRRSEGTGALAPSGAGGVLGIDPLLVAAPALALLAGTVLVLRLLPLAARLGERYAARRRGLAGALAGWQLARRPQRAARPALLLVLAVATGVLAVGQGASWDRSQDDQADFRTGADLTVSGSAPSPLAQGGLFDDVPGITRAAPVVRTTVTTDGSREARLLATDTAAAADGVLRLRDDLAGRPLPRLLRPLAGKGAGRRAGLRLPPGTDRLALRLRLDGPGRARGPAAARSGLALAVTVTDRFGVPYRLPLGDIPADGRTRTLTARLTDGGGSPAGPLRLTRIGVSHHVPRHDAGRRLTVEALHAHGRFGHRTVHPATASRWTPRVRPDDASTASGGQYAVATARPARVRPRGAPVTLRWTTGSAPAPKPDGNDGPGTVSVEWKPHEAAAAPLAAVATDSYLRAGGSTVGDTVTVRVADTELDVRITGAVRALPTVTPRDSDDGQPDAGALLCDLGALDRALADRGADPLEPRTWWLSAESGGTARAAQALRDRPAVGTVRVRDEIADALRSDPLGAGPRSALTALVPAAALLSATGFAVAAAGAARERAGDLAVLRALGAPRRRLARAVAAEQGLVVALSAALGLALGTVLTRLFVPLLVVTGGRAAPPCPTSWCGCRPVRWPGWWPPPWPSPCSSSRARPCAARPRRPPCVRRGRDDHGGPPPRRPARHGCGRPARSAGRYA